MTSAQASQETYRIPEAQLEAMCRAALDGDDMEALYAYLRLAMELGYNAMGMYSTVISGYGYKMPRYFEAFMDAMADGLGHTDRPWHSAAPPS